VKKRTKRKIWQLVDPIKHAISGAAITPQAERDKLLLRELAALDDFTKGGAKMEQWNDLASVVNLCETIAREHIGAEALPFCQAAQDELIKTADRYKQTGRFGLSGPGITALREVIEYHDAQRASITRSEYERLIRLCTAHVRNGYRTVVVGA